MVNHRHILITQIAVFLLVLVGVAGVWFVTQRAPDAPSIEDATSLLRDGSEAATPRAGAAAVAEREQLEDESTADDTAAAATAALDGAWGVDRSIGSYTYENPESSFVGIRVREELAGIGASTAAIRTPNVAGSVAIVDGVLVAAEVEVDMASLRSDNDHRDSHVASAIRADEFPLATFALTRAEELDLVVDGSGRMHVTANGDLTIAGMTRPYAVPLAAEVVGDIVVVVGGVDITFSDFGVEAPTSSVALSVADTGYLEIQLFLTRGTGDELEPLPAPEVHEH